MEVTSALGAPAAPVPTACASCVFGAYSSKILSFTSSYISHITVSVTPHIYAYNNGSRSTSFESNTLTESSIVGGIAGSSTTQTYARKDEITWTVDGATLTYPTKYVQYVGFKGVPAATAIGEMCAEETEASEISLPATTDAASFIYALPANATGLPLPNQLLQYLGGLDDLVEQFDGAPLSGCAPLDGAHSGAGNGSLPHLATDDSSLTELTRTFQLSSGYMPETGGLTYSLSDRTSSSDMRSVLSLGPTSYAASSGTSSPWSSASTGSSASGSMLSSSNAMDDGYEFSTTADNVRTSRSSSSSAKFSILPHPYLNTTVSQTSSSSQSLTSHVPETSSSLNTESTGVSMSTSAAVTSPSDASISRTSTFTIPGGVFLPSHDPVDHGEQSPPSETVVSSSTTGKTPPKASGGPPNPGGNAPEEVPPDDNDDNSDDDNEPSYSPSSAAMSTTAQITHEAPSQPAMESQPSGQGENDHTTAFVIEPITGSALITYESEPTRSSGVDGKVSDTTTAGGGAPDAHVGVVESTPTPAPDVSNLIDQIGTIANESQDNFEPDSHGSTPAGTDSNDFQTDGGSPNAPAGGNQSGKDTDSAGDGGGFSEQGSSEGQGIDLIDAINSVANQQAGNRNEAGSGGTHPANAAASPAPMYSAGNTVVTAQPGGAVVVGDQTVAPGQSVTIGSGSATTVVALETNAASTNLIVGGSTVPVMPQRGTITAAPESVTEAASMALITTNGQTITAIQAGSSLLLQCGSSTSTVAANEAATFAGETILAMPTEHAVFVNGNILPLTAAKGVEGASQAVISANGHTITALDAENSVLLVDGSMTRTLLDGSDAVFQGQTFSAQETGMAVVVNGHTSSLTSAVAFATGQAIITTGAETFSVFDLPGYVVLQDGSASMAIRDGATATFQGQTITALQSGNAVVVNGTTLSMTEPVATAQAVITAGAQSFTAVDMEGYLILQDGTSTLTVKDGQTANFDGQTIRALASGEAVVVNGKTWSFSSVAATPTDDVNQYINKGLDGGSESTSSQTVGASPGPTGAPEGNSAKSVSTTWTGLVVAGLLGLVIVL